MAAPLAACVAGLLLALGPALEPGTQDAFDEARGLRRAGNPGEAAQTLRTQLSGHRSEGDYVGLLGLCLMDAGALDEAAALFRELGAGTGESFRMEILRGRLAQGAGELEAAQEAFQHATRLNPRAVEAWVALVRASMTAQRFGRALKNAERLEAVNPDVGRAMASDILRLQGDSYLRQGVSTIELASDKYAAALEKTPEDEALATLVLETQLNAFRVVRVRELVASRFSADSQAVNRHYWTGRRLAVEQDASGARAAFEAALELDAEHAESALWLAKLALDDGQLTLAQAWLDRCGAAGLQTAQTELLMGEVLMGLGDLAAAEQRLRTAAKLDPNLTKALYLLGRVLMRAGKPEEAREVLARFTELSKPPPTSTGGR